MLPKFYSKSKPYELLSKLRIVDLSHIITFDIPTWSGDISYEAILTKEITSQDLLPRVVDNRYHYRSYHFSINQNCGTHIDSPNYMINNSPTCSEISLDKLVHIPLCIINVIKKVEKTLDYELSIEDIEEYESKYSTIPDNSFVVCYTSWDKHWNNRNKYRNETNGKMAFPRFSYEAIKFLTSKRNILGIGIDTLSPETDLNFPIHKHLLEQGKHIVKNLTNLGSMPDWGGVINILVPKIRDVTEIPVRVYGLCEI